MDAAPPVASSFDQLFTSSFFKMAAFKRNLKGNTVFDKIIDKIEAFKFHPSDAQALINGTRQYPVWFIIQAIWCTYAVRSSAKYRKSTLFSKVMEFITSFIMTFGGREIAAYVLDQSSPLMINKISIGVFVCIFVLMNIPFIYQIFDSFNFFVGFAHGLNQERLYTKVIRRLITKKQFTKYDLFFYIPAVCSSFDQIVCSIYGIFTGITPYAASIRGACYTILFEYIHLSAISVNLLNSWIGLFSDWTKPNMFLAIALGFFNGKTSRIPKLARKQLEAESRQRRFEEERKRKFE